MSSTKPKSNTLFHFTKHIDNLFSILSGRCFWPRYCEEDVRWLHKSEQHSDNENDTLELLASVAYPMVCFCDIPLSRINSHVEQYGYYGIGLSRNWAKKNNICPVLYVDGESTIGPAKTINQLIGFYDYFPCGIEGDLFYSKLRKLIAYVKPTIGFMNINGKSSKKEFYQESEWRYVVNLDMGDSEFLGGEHELSKKAEHNEKTREHMLHFDIDDIEYIFVKNEEEVMALIAKYQKFLSEKAEYFAMLNVEDLKLFTKIISLSKISQDI